jgi:hypothetical protein
MSHCKNVLTMTTTLKNERWDYGQNVHMEPRLKENEKNIPTFYNGNNTPNAHSENKHTYEKQ